MASKTVIFFFLCLATFALIASEVSAIGLAEPTSSKSKETNGVADAKYDGGHSDGARDGFGGGGRGGGGGYGRGGGYGYGRCYHGCCRRNYYRRGCRRCCRYAGEAVDTLPEAESHN